MEVFREIVGDAHTDETLRNALLMYDDNLERAIDFLLQQSAGLTEHAIVHAVPPQMVANPLHSRFGDMSSAQLRSIDHSETFLVQQSLSYFPDIDNGDCVYYCLYQLLQQLAPSSTRVARTTLAEQMRRYINDYIESQWYQPSSIVSMTWAELITLAHNTAVTEEELDT
jgi:hypothetical protein